MYWLALGIQLQLAFLHQSGNVGLTQSFVGSFVHSEGQFTGLVHTVTYSYKRAKLCPQGVRDGFFEYLNEHVPDLDLFTGRERVVHQLDDVELFLQIQTGQQLVQLCDDLLRLGCNARRFLRILQFLGRVFNLLVDRLHERICHGFHSALHGRTKSQSSDGRLD